MAAKKKPAEEVATESVEAPPEQFGPPSPDRITLQPGIYFDVSHDHYHADPAPEPSLSASQCEAMLETSPHRVWFANRRMNPDAPGHEATKAMDEGSALHRLMMGVGPEVAVIDAGDYKTNAAKAARDAARAVGAIPILAARMVELREIAAHVRRQIEAHPEAREVLSDDYASEVTMICREPTGAWLRARADRMHRFDPRAPIYDFKFTQHLRSPFAWDKGFLDSWWDMRAAFYGRVGWRLRGHMQDYRYIICELEPPFDAMVLQATPELLNLGERKAETAIHAWESCMAAGNWPRYPNRIFHIAPPGYAESRWEERPSIDHMLPAPKLTDGGERQSLWDWLQSNPENLLMAG